MISKENRNRAQRDAIIDMMYTGQKNGISCMVKAFLKMPYKLNPKQINMLMKNQEFIKGLTNGHIPVKIRKKIIKQRGGILGLIPLAAKVIAPTLLGSIVICLNFDLIQFFIFHGSSCSLGQFFPLCTTYTICK